MSKHFGGEIISSGADLRRQLLGNLCAMLRPIRIMLDLDRERLAILSGLPEELITDVEEGRVKFTEAHYLPLSAVFSNAKFTAEEKIYQALIKILLPFTYLPENIFDDFGLVRLWLDTYEEDNCEDEPDDSFGGDDDSFYDEDGMTDRLDPEKIVGEYKLIADESAVADENFPTLVTRLEPLIRKSGVSLAITESVSAKLREKIETGDSDERLSLSSSLNYLRRKQEERLIEILPSSTGDYDDSESELLNIIEASKGTRYLLITQEYERAAAVFGVGNTISARIDDNGDLISWEN